MRALRQEGYICGKVEYFNPYVGDHGARIDLFGFIDIIAIRPIGIAGIQSCGQDFAKHDRTIRHSEIAVEWVKAGGTIELWGWRKLVVKRGGKLKRWQPRVKVYQLEDFDA